LVGVLFYEQGEDKSVYPRKFTENQVKRNLQNREDDDRNVTN
jgi:hypothetical protein